MLSRIFTLMIKEFIELRRDKWAWLRLILLPLLQVIIFGYAVTFEVFSVSTAVLDLDHSQESRDLISRFTYTGRFNVVRIARTQADITRAIDRGDATVAITVYPRFAEYLRNGQSAPLQVVVDGTNSNTAMIALGYVGQIVSQFSQDYASDFATRLHGGGQGSRIVQIVLEQRPWYNPDLNSRWFFVPGVIAISILTIVINLTSFAVVREREVGTLEQIMVAPIRPLEFIIGKAVPFFIVGLALVSLIAAVGTLWFRVPFVGNLLVLLLGTSLYLVSVLGIGLLISTLCSTQQQAFATNFFVINPMFILSGFSFPIGSMPDALQWLTYLNPVRYYLIIIRGTFLKGVGVAVLWPEMLALALLATGLLTLCVLRFHKSLD
ncbi:MAG: ABC transporter permease [Methylovirgula sp.]